VPGSILSDGHLEKRGEIRASVLSESEENIVTSLTEAFEQALSALPQSVQREIEIVTTRVRRMGRTTALAVVVDAPGGADLALCERVAERINAALVDRPEPYTLEVESPGLDRPLLRAADYVRFHGSPARIQTTLAVNGAKTHRGTLAGMRGNAVILSTPSGDLPLPLEMIKAAHLDVDIRADLAREKRERRRS